MTSKLRYFTKDFELVDGKKGKKMLRFTMCWELDHPVAGLQGSYTGGCIAVYNKGELTWKYPLNYFGAGRKQLHDLTPGTYRAILESLKRSKHLPKIQNVLDNFIQDEKLEEEINEIEY